jgi:enoyl-CoA hydratase
VRRDLRPFDDRVDVGRGRREMSDGTTATDGGYEHVVYSTLHEGTLARIELNRPAVRNAQHRPLLVELDDAFHRAESDDAVCVVILSGVGTMFSSGHDMGSKEHLEERDPGPNQHVTRRTNGGSREGVEARMLQEWHYFFENTRRWRSLRKITIAQVHGPVFAAGLMLMWACDLIVAAEGTTFADVVGTRLGMCGVEYFGHPWEFGPRKAKELLLTGDSMSAEEAHQLGMVSKVFPADRLAELTERWALRIARVPTMTALLVKEAVNQAVDIMGFTNALNAAFTLHQVNHAHWMFLNEDGTPVGTPALGVPSWRDAPPVAPARRDTPGDASPDR